MTAQDERRRAAQQQQQQNAAGVELNPAAAASVVCCILPLTMTIVASMIAYFVFQAWGLQIYYDVKNTAWYLGTTVEPCLYEMVYYFYVSGWMFFGGGLILALLRCCVQGPDPNKELKELTPMLIFFKFLEFALTTSTFGVVIWGWVSLRNKATYYNECDSYIYKDAMYVSNGIFGTAVCSYLSMFLFLCISYPVIVATKGAAEKAEQGDRTTTIVEFTKMTSTQRILHSMQATSAPAAETPAAEVPPAIDIEQPTVVIVEEVARV